MKIDHIYAVWFSGTGTTQKVVTTIAKDISDKFSLPYEEYSFNLPKAREREMHFLENDLVILGVPVYAGRVPNLIMPYIQNMVFGDHTLAIPVVLFGNRNFDDGLIELRNLMASNGFSPIAAGAFVGEHSFSKILGAGRPDDEDMRLVQELAEKAAEKIESLAEIPDTIVEVDGCEPIRPYYTPRDKAGNPVNILKAKPVTDLEKCSNCRLCAELCVMGSIEKADVTKVTGKCIKCCACIKKCPTGAKYFDDTNYLYHQHDLEEVYSARRAESRIFL